MAEKKITGCFTGAYALNPFNGREIPIWISEYVLGRLWNRRYHGCALR